MPAGPSSCAAKRQILDVFLTGKMAVITAHRHLQAPWASNRLDARSWDCHKINSSGKLFWSVLKPKKYSRGLSAEQTSTHAHVHASTYACAACMCVCKVHLLDGSHGIVLVAVIISLCQSIRVSSRMKMILPA
eukprot:366336-Chlamydomonas_euryale.AAC.16